MVRKWAREKDARPLPECAHGRKGGRPWVHSGGASCPQEPEDHERIHEAQYEKKNCPICNIDGHLSSHAELAPKYQKCEGRLVLRGDIVKDDSGSYAVFTEPSQITAAEVMDVIAKLPECAGQSRRRSIQSNFL